MSYVLNIDTAIETASVSIAENGVIRAMSTNAVQKDHAGFLHPAIKGMLEELSLELNAIDAVAVTIGPGSYTGLRVGLASAKGLSYALGKPLITINTLEAIALNAIKKSEQQPVEDVLFCPMIDARRMEVYTALYDTGLNAILSPCAVILDSGSFAAQLENNRIIFTGSGAEKWSRLIQSENAFFYYDTDISFAINELSNMKFLSGAFTDLKYSEPLYVKEFFFAS